MPIEDGLEELGLQGKTELTPGFPQGKTELTPGFPARENRTDTGFPPGFPGFPPRVSPPDTGFPPGFPQMLANGIGVKFLSKAESVRVSSATG